MTSATLDRERLRKLFDLRSSYNAYTGGTYEDDPYPIWHRLRDKGPVLPGILHELTGSTDMMFFHGLPYPDSRHFTVFDYDSCMIAYLHAIAATNAGSTTNTFSTANTMSFARSPVTSTPAT